MKQIPSKIYNKIIHQLPIACVDICLVNDSNQILLVKRNEEPAKGLWWVPGGRIHIGETIEQAASRKIKEEVNIDEIQLFRIGFDETIFKNNDGVIRHSLNAIVKGHITNEQLKDLKLDNTSFCWAWHNDPIVKIEHPYVIKCINAIK